MGQYHYIVNHSRREYIDPCMLGLGPKLIEFQSTLMSAVLTLLLAKDDSESVGDFGVPNNHPMRGRWAMNAISIHGDYSTTFPKGYEGSWSEVSADCLHALVHSKKQDYFRSLVSDMSHYLGMYLTEDQKSQLNQYVQKHAIVSNIASGEYNVISE